MPAETLAYHDNVEPDDLVIYIVEDFAGLDAADLAAARTLSLEDCGAGDATSQAELLSGLAEEFGERAFSPDEAQDLAPGTTVAELVDLLGQHLATDDLQ